MGLHNFFSIAPELKADAAREARQKKKDERERKKVSRWGYLLRAIPKAETRRKGDRVFAASDRLYIQDGDGQLWRARKGEDGKVERTLPRAERKARQWKRLGYTLGE